MRTPCIYCITNNNKSNYFYIGGTLRSIGDRWDDHIGELRNNKHDNMFLQNIYNKYGENGWEKWELKRLPSDITREDVTKIEFSYMDKFVSEGKNLYNAILKPRNSYPTESGRKRLSDRMKTNNPMSNPEIVRKMQDTRKKDRENFNEIIYIFDSHLNIIFSSRTILEASNFIKTNSGNVSKALSKRCPVRGFLISRNKEDKFKDIFVKYKGGELYDPNNKYLMIDQETGLVLKEFDTAKEAADLLSVDPSNIIRAVSGETKSCANYLWIKKNKYSTEKVLEKIKILNERKKITSESIKKRSESQNKKVAQLCLKTGKVIEVFDSVKDCGNILGIDASNISRSANGKTKKCAGFKFKYL